MSESIMLGIIQGVTEFLPISSTAHLVLLPWFFGWAGQMDSLTFDVALHAGTLMSLFICFWEDIRDMFRKDYRLFMLIVVGTVPAGFAGVFFHDYVASELRSPTLIAFSLIIVGGVMYGSERMKGNRSVKGLGVLDAVLIGIAQAVALVPGVSRSGITISAGLMRGMKRYEALRFSFLLSMPAIGGATVLEGSKLVKDAGQYDLGLFIAGFFASMVTGVIAIKFMLRYLKTHTMNVFVIYRVVLAGVILGWIWLGG